MIIESKEKLGDSLYAIGRPGLPAFLLIGKTPALFDAGMSFMGPLYWEDLKTHLGDPKILRYLFLTHAHFDHCGAGPYLKRKTPDLQVGANRIASETLKKPNAIQLIKDLSKDYESKYTSLVGEEDITFDSLPIDVILEDGMDFDLGRGFGFKVIATPGHTRDSVSFYIPKLKALITGESVGVYDKNMNIHPEFLASYNDYLASLDKLANLDLDILMMSHFFTLTGDDAKGYVAKSIVQTKIFRDRIERSLDEFQGDRKAVVKKIFKEDYEDTGAILQEARPYLINLDAKVRVVAEGK